MYKFINYKRAVYHYNRFMNGMKSCINVKFYFLVCFSCQFILLLLYFLLNTSLVYFIGMYFVFDVCLVYRDVALFGEKI